MLKETLQDERKRLASALEERMIDGKQRIAFAELKTLELPDMLLGSLQKQARSIFKNEKPIRIIQSDRFDFSDDKIKDELTRLRDILLEQVYFAPTEIRKAINLSMTLHFDLAIQPFDTAAAILFQNADEKKCRESIEILNNIGEKLPPVKALSERLLVHDAESIDRDGLSKLADVIKAEVYAENPVSSMLFDIDYLKQFYDAIFENGESAFAADVVHAMLRERGMSDFEKGFEEQKSQKKFWNIEDIQQFLERFLLVGQLQHDNSFSSHIYYSEKEDEADTRKPASDIEVEPVPEAHEEPEPQRTAKAETEQEDKPKNGITEVPTEPAAPSRRSRNVFHFDDTDLIDRKKIEYQPPGPYPSLESIIDNKSRNLFIKKIFKKDKLAYLEFIENIEKKESWKEAKAILDKELNARKISHFCREAVKLSDLIFARYFSKGKF